MLSLINMECKYDNVIYTNITIKDIGPGLNFIVGRSGCGKTSLVKSIIGLNDHSKGEVIFNGRKIYDFRRFREEYVSYVFQEDKLIPYYTVYENLMMVSNDKYKIQKLINKLHLSSKLYDYPNTLSGGQRQRVNIIRACLKNTYINIFDEPTASVNDELKEDIMNLIVEMFKNKTVIIISHNEKLVNKYATRIINLMDKSDRIINHIESAQIVKQQYRPPLFKLNLYSYKKRSKMPLFVICIVYLLVLVTISLFQGIDNYVDYNIKKKQDYQYFYIINGKNDDLSTNVIRYNLKSNFDITEIIDYRSSIIDNYLINIRFNNIILDEYYEIHVYDGDYPIMMNKQLYELTKTNEITFMSLNKKAKVIDDGKLYTAPALYFDYSFLYSIFGEIESKNYAFKTPNYNDVYAYLSSNYDNIYTFNDDLDTIKYDNSTIMIKESLEPLLKSIHSLIVLLTFSIIIMALTFIDTLINYNIKLRSSEIEIFNYFGLNHINRIKIYESILLTILPWLFSLLLFIYLSPLFDKMSILLLNEPFKLFHFNINLVLYTGLLTAFINLIAIYGNRLIKNKQKLQSSKSFK